MSRTYAATLPKSKPTCARCVIAWTRRIDRLESKFDSLQGAFSDIKDELANTKVWALLLYIALAAGTFGTMARAFGWF
jgi:hypothetical protein